MADEVETPEMVAADADEPVGPVAAYRDTDPQVDGSQEQPQSLEEVMAGEANRGEPAEGEVDERQAKEDRSHEKVKVTALHQIIHDGKQKLPGDQFTVERRQADEMLGTRTVVLADAEDEELRLKESEHARLRALRLSGRGTALPVNLHPGLQDIEAPKIRQNEG